VLSNNTVGAKGERKHTQVLQNLPSYVPKSTAMAAAIVLTSAAAVDCGNNQRRFCRGREDATNAMPRYI
jgi:hypothetical protein